jgi:hypothetical protein
MAGILTIVDGDEIHEAAIAAARNHITKLQREYGGALVSNYYRAALVTPNAGETGASWSVIYGPVSESDELTEPAADKDRAIEIAERYVATGSIEAKD